MPAHPVTTVTTYLALSIAGAAPAWAQHDGHPPAGAARTDSSATSVVVGAHAVPLVTHVARTALGRRMTEGYLSQVAAMAGVSAWRGRVELLAMVNFEGLTLERGELTTGAYGEGYVDRRHPHTYLHEVIATLRTRPTAPAGFSVSIGRGFATFGSDDPMVRPFVKYPVNHHLAQVLERGLVAAAVRAGPVMLEGSRFNGDEPTHAGDLPTAARFGDSWAARLTLVPTAAVELSASHAWVESPENEAGFGADHRKWHAAVRVRHQGSYALAEWARDRAEDGVRIASPFDSFLLEGAHEVGRLVGALRLERTDRHEEERLGDPFRTAVPPTDVHVLGVTRWTTATAGLAMRPTRAGRLGFAPFLEAAWIGVAERGPSLFRVVDFYGGRRHVMLSVGARLSAGGVHARMGRYGVALATPHHSRNVPTPTGLHH